MLVDKLKASLTAPVAKLLYVQREFFTTPARAFFVVKKSLRACHGVGEAEDGSPRMWGGIIARLGLCFTIT